MPANRHSDHAVAHGDEHVIKLTDTALDAHQRTGDPDTLAAATYAAVLIERQSHHRR